MGLPSQSLRSIAIRAGTKDDICFTLLCIFSAVGVGLDDVSLVCLLSEAAQLCGNVSMHIRHHVEDLKC